MKNLGTFRLYRGEDFTKTFYLGTYKEIISSTNASPSVLTVTAHGAVTNDKRQIQGHLSNAVLNNTSDNPFHTVTKITDDTLSVPVAAISEGHSGTILKPTNLTGKTVSCQFRKYAMSTETAADNNVLFSPTVDSSANPTIGEVVVSVAKALTFSDNENGLTLDKYRADILVDDELYGFFDIECVKTVTR